MRRLTLIFSLLLSGAPAGFANASAPTCQDVDIQLSQLDEGQWDNDYWRAYTASKATYVGAAISAWVTLEAAEQSLTAEQVEALTLWDKSLECYPFDEAQILAAVKAQTQSGEAGVKKTPEEVVSHLSQVQDDFDFNFPMSFRDALLDAVKDGKMTDELEEQKALIQANVEQRNKDKEMEAN